MCVCVCVCKWFPLLLLLKEKCCVWWFEVKSGNKSADIVLLASCSLPKPFSQPLTHTAPPPTHTHTQAYFLNISHTSPRSFFQHCTFFRSLIFCLSCVFPFFLPDTTKGIDQLRSLNLSLISICRQGNTELYTPPADVSSAVHFIPVHHRQAEGCQLST